MEQLFSALHEDFATLKQEIAAEVKDLKRDVADLGQRVDTLEQTHDLHKEELDCHWRELLNLQDRNQELQYQLEDLENRSHCSDICIIGLPTQVVTGSGGVHGLSLPLYGPALKDLSTVLDRTHRAGGTVRSPCQVQHILTCLHYYKQREAILVAIHDQTTIEFDGHRIGLFQDLLKL
ncbi:hypothetical protein NDU88_001917 [Pleurodeles waltl]|uniref:Uncharacterized protein n=1 Tax=Pleurodeles waltl TaxID=8319 RepID=A0AAV7NLK4_PLEWA|nr:hypothetical protein NDU88_001917 [Pleurodeles waltl]